MGIGAKNKAYIKNLRSGTITKFQYNPTSFNVGRDFNYTELTAPGISYPQFQYVGGGVKTITFKVFLYGTGGEPKNFIAHMNDLMPKESSQTQFQRPPELLFAYGDYIKRCILVSFTEDYNEFNSKDLSPKYVEWNMTLKVVA